MNTWIELDISALQANIRQTQKALSENTEIIFVVKSDAYGHGMIQVSQAAWNCDVTWFGVAHIEEALALRESLPEANILVMGVLPPEAVSTAARCRAIPILANASHALAIARAAEAQNLRLPCHAKIDTGMGRLGFAWESAGSALAPLASRDGLSLCGICSHFASSHASDPTFADIQAERFRQVINDCAAEGLQIPFRHISNSGAILGRPDDDIDAVRPGILLYGYTGNVPSLRLGKIQPCLQWKTRIVQIRPVPAGFSVSYDCTYQTPAPTTLGIIDVGYADGYPRALSNCGQVIVGGRLCPVVGRVTMNLTTIDLGLDSQAQPGDEVILIGASETVTNWADALAHAANTIPYDILTGICCADRRTSAGNRPQTP